MYVVQCLTGREADIQGELAKVGYMGRVPTAVRLERCGGRWLDRLRVLMPGYVFVDSPMNNEIYYNVKAVTGVIRWLNPGKPVKLTDDEAEFVRRLTTNNLPLLPLELEVTPRLRVLTGPLAGLEHRIVSVDRHQRRAVISVRVLGKEHRLNLSAHFKDIPT